MGLKTLLATGNLNMTASMPCNPSIGGPAKGVVVREIDALGGYMGKNADSLLTLGASALAKRLDHLDFPRFSKW